MYVGILPSPTNLDQIFFTSGEARAEGKPVARTGVEHNARVRSRDMRLDRKTHARAVTDEWSEVKTERLRFGFLRCQRSRGNEERHDDEGQHAELHSQFLVR